MLKVSLAKALEFFRKASPCDVSLHSQSLWSSLVPELGMSLNQRGLFACFPLTPQRWGSLTGKLAFFPLSPLPYLLSLSFPPPPFWRQKNSSCAQVNAPLTLCLSAPGAAAWMRRLRIPAGACGPWCSSTRGSRTYRRSPTLPGKGFYCQDVSFAWHAPKCLFSSSKSDGKGIPGWSGG